MNNEELLNVINTNKKVVIILGLEVKNNLLIDDFIKANFKVSEEQLKQNLGFENRETFFPILEKEFNDFFPFIFIKEREIEKLPFLKPIINEIFSLPTILFIKSGEIQPIKYGYYNTYSQFKEVLEEFKYMQ